MNPSLIPFVDVVAKGSAVLLLAMGIVSLWRGASASQRSLVWLLCFGTLLLLPFTASLRPRWFLDVPGTSASVAVTAIPVAPAPTEMAHPLAPEAAASPEAPPAMMATAKEPLTVLQILAITWAAGVSLVLLGRGVGSVRLRLLRSQTLGCSDKRVLTLASDIKRDLQIHRSVDLRTSRAINVPMTWGFIRPVLLLPEEALAWSSNELDAALRHEMGHIRHWDAVSRGLMVLVCAMYWFNPLVWFAAKRWRTAQEQASDDLVVNHGGNPEAYAMQLLNAARHVQRSGFLRLPAMTMARASTLETRLSAIMDDGKNRQSVRRVALLAGAGVGIGIFIACASLQLQAAPPPSLKAGGKYAVIDCIVAECTGEDAVEKVVAMSLKNSAARKGSQSIPGELATLPGVRLFASGRTYAPVETESGISTTRAVAEGGGLSIPFHAFPVVTPDGLSLIIRRPMKEMRGSAANSGASVRSEPNQTIVTLRPNGIVALDTNSGREAPRRRYIYMLAASAVQADANGNIPSSGQAPGVVGGPDGMGGKPSLVERATKIRIPSVEFKNATMAEVIEFIRVQAKQHDPTGQGLTLHLSEGAAKSKARVTLSLKNVGVTIALGTAAHLVDMRLHQEDNSFWISTREEMEAQRYIPAQPASTSPQPAGAATSGGHAAGSGALQRAQSIILPTVEFNGASLKEVVEFFSVKSRENDSSGKGVNIVLSSDAADSTAKLTLNLKSVPLSEALRYTAELSLLELTADEVSLFLKKKEEDTKSKPEATAPVKSAAWEKAGKIILPRVKFSYATVPDAVDFLNIKGKEMDPEKQGVSIVLAKSETAVLGNNGRSTLRTRISYEAASPVTGTPETKGGKADPDKPEATINLAPKGSGWSTQVTLDLTDVPLSEAVRYVAELAGMEVVAEQHALFLRPKAAQK